MAIRNRLKALEDRPGRLLLPDSEAPGRVTLPDTPEIRAALETVERVASERAEEIEAEIRRRRRAGQDPRHAQEFATIQALRNDQEGRKALRVITAAEFTPEEEG